MLEKKNYPALDIMKIVCAIFVIANHTSPFLPYSYWLNFIVIHIFARLVVPFYFFNSAYNVGFKDKGDFVYYRKYLANLFKTYLLWSIAYVPIGLIALSQYAKLTPLVISGGLVAGFMYIGTYFHLWYLAAIIFALWLLYILLAKFKIKLKYIAIIAFVLFLFGACETYYGIIGDTVLKSVVDLYFSILYTTRNGLFFGLIYIVVGYTCGRYRLLERFSLKQKLDYSIILFVLVCCEAFICRLLFSPKDYNILLLALPFTVVFYGFLLDYIPKRNYPLRAFRLYSSLMYFTHGAYLVLVPLILEVFSLQHLFEIGYFKFAVVLVLSFISSYLLIKLKEKNSNKYIQLL